MPRRRLWYKRAHETAPPLRRPGPGGDAHGRSDPGGPPGFRRALRRAGGDAGPHPGGCPAPRRDQPPHARLPRRRPPARHQDRLDFPGESGSLAAAAHDPRAGGGCGRRHRAPRRGAPRRRAHRHPHRGGLRSRHGGTRPARGADRRGARRRGAGPHPARGDGHREAGDRKRRGLRPPNRSGGGVRRRDVGAARDPGAGRFLPPTMSSPPPR